MAQDDLSAIYPLKHENLLVGKSRSDPLGSTIHLSSEDQRKAFASRHESATRWAVDQKFR